MQDSQLYQQILGITTPWRVERVELQLKQGKSTCIWGMNRSTLDVPGVQSRVSFVRP